MPTQANQGEQEVNSMSSEPQNALNKAFRKVKPDRADFETFKTQLGILLSRVEPTESEEFHKNLITSFLKKTYYDARFINTKNRNDLVIHEGPSADTPVGVILETKKPGNKSEMPSHTDLNRKALHELVLYYLRERVTNQNLNLKHLVVTDTYQWFIFDASTFEKTFAENKAFVRTYEDFAVGRLTGTKTEFFYNNIAKPFIAQLDTPLPFTFVDLRDYRNDLADEATEEVEDIAEKRIITLYKLFSPEHLLKLPFANDSNTLDKTFYAELLHIVGLTEKKVGGKKLIVRQEEPDDASLIENAVVQLENLDKLSRLEQPADYGDNREDQLFNVALELAITWVNRVLFLKLLESQLLNYHKHQKNVRDDYAFLNAERLKSYNELNVLFFSVLARPAGERPASVAAYKNIPYLNSSLFELTDLEQRTITLNDLRDNRELELYPGTVLKDADGKKRTGRLTTLAYLFAFLDAYDFSSEGSEAVQEDGKRLINASVLGLIFEKINGYKDGSFFTPGFITMYMCRETIRSAVVQKFNSAKGWDCQTITELYNKITDKRGANEIVNSLKICDPAVGSGHFLVSALNEIVALKSELKILMDDEGKVLRDYTLEVSNDELVVTDENGELFEYKPQNAESQRVQKTLFHEKQTLIENCLFGVDINPNSVKICRLRLWIELLKNAYYKPDGALETLPNIDINIKTGNSLISRYALDVDLKRALKKSGLTVEAYRNAVSTYRNAVTKDEKRDMERLIAGIKTSFRTEIANNDPKVVRLETLTVRLASLAQTQLFEETAAQKNERDKLTTEVSRLAAEIEAVKNNKVFENAFEWRFEFPEVLDENGDFVGFDVVLGNPPYINLQKIESQGAMSYYATKFESYRGKADLLYLFLEQAATIVKDSGRLEFIVANYFLRSHYADSLRNVLTKEFRFERIVDFGSTKIFDSANVDTCILEFKKSSAKNPEFEYTLLLESKSVLEFLQSLSDQTFETQQFFVNNVNQTELAKEPWQFDQFRPYQNAKIFPLEQFCNIGKGAATGGDDIFVVDRKIVDKYKIEEALLGDLVNDSSIDRYAFSLSDMFLIKATRGIDISAFPKAEAYLNEYKDTLSERYAVRKEGVKWYEIVRCSDLLFGGDISQQIFCYYRSPYNKFAYSDKKYTTLTTTFVLTKTGDIGLKYLVGLLNSKLLQKYSVDNAKKMGGTYEYSSNFLKSIPIRTIDFSNPADQTAHDRMTHMVDTMLDLHTQKAAASGDALAALETRITELDASIDALVYALYGLTEEEIAVVEAAVAG